MEKKREVKRALKVIKSLILWPLRTFAFNRKMFKDLSSGWNDEPTFNHNNMRGDDRHRHVWNVMDNHNTQKHPLQDTQKHFLHFKSISRKSSPGGWKGSFSHFAPLFRVFRLTGEKRKQQICVGKFSRSRQTIFPHVHLFVCFWCVCYCCDGSIVFKIQDASGCQSLHFNNF